MKLTKEEIEKKLKKILSELESTNEQKNTLIGRLKNVKTLEERIQIEKEITQLSKDFQTIVDNLNEPKNQVSND